MSSKKGKALRERFNLIVSKLKNSPLIFSHLSQTALEFLTTYGWTLLVVLTAISVLAYFGVLSPDKFLPSRCVLPAGISCLDYRVESYRVILVLQNGLGEAITIDEVTVSTNSQQCSDNQSIFLKNSEKAVITIIGCGNGESGQKFDSAINVTYTPEDKLKHTVAGTLKSKVVEGLSVSSQDICQNAANNTLCDGLDIVYGIGYKAACCGEYSLCC